MNTEFPSADDATLPSSSNWLKQISFAAQPIRSTSQILVVTRRQCRISALLSHFRGKPVVASKKCQLFSQQLFVERSVVLMMQRMAVKEI